jgi:hypothetical protein
MHNEELHNLYSSSDVIRRRRARRMRRIGHVACMATKRYTCRIVVRKPEVGTRKT